MNFDVVDFSQFDVLIAEDNQFVRRLVREVLYGFGVGKVREVADGGRALHEVQKSAPDLIICDWVMAPLDGLSLLRKLREDGRGRTRRIPVIILSGHATDNHVAQALGEGADSYIVKPFNATTLMTHILKVVREEGEVMLLA